jgi:hypothetical protein
MEKEKLSATSKIGLCIIALQIFQIAETVFRYLAK